MEYASHIGQDRWVAEVFGNLKGGYFLDFGAFDGVSISNTLYLERALGWTGICVEPNPTYYPRLCAERRAICLNAALWPQPGETVRLVDAHGLSTIETFAREDDINAEWRARETKRVVEIETLNPTQVLDRFGAPSIIPYMSLDVEGCEFEILSAIDLKRYNILLMTIEHNHDAPKKERIRAYLAERGYGVVQNKNDDFFFKREGVRYGNDPGALAELIDRTYPIRE